ncbi:MAG: general stress protein [Sphingomonadales bacterium]|nr:general stress protein [Sphingomonadales bacterium]MBU3991910.1 pyridoxamine 5'-phosphate oxidase family protein [Alphaproteobacteria bacterium]
MKYRDGDPHEMKDKFWHALDQSPYLMLQLDAEPGSAAPMTASLDEDADHAIWFFCGRDTRFARLGPATATFANRDHDLFARFAGTLSAETDRARLDRQWTKHVAEWFPEGKDDPNLLLVRMDLGPASIWCGEVGVLDAAKQLLGMDLHKAAKGRHAETAL